MLAAHKGDDGDRQKDGKGLRHEQGLFVVAESVEGGCGRGDERHQHHEEAPVLYAKPGQEDVAGDSNTEEDIQQVHKCTPRT